jgi:hypothetical protein
MSLKDSQNKKKMVEAVSDTEINDIWKMLPYYPLSEITVKSIIFEWADTAVAHCEFKRLGAKKNPYCVKYVNQNMQLVEQ